jgi:hypothetical protein
MPPPNPPLTCPPPFPCKNIAIFRVELFPRTVFEHHFCLFDRTLNVPRLGQPESLSNRPSMNWALICNNALF